MEGQTLGNTRGGGCTLLFKRDPQKYKHILSPRGYADRSLLDRNGGEQLGSYSRVNNLRKSFREEYCFTLMTVVFPSRGAAFKPRGCAHRCAILLWGFTFLYKNGP